MKKFVVTNVLKVAAVTAALFVGAPAGAQQPEMSAVDLLARMSQAAREVSYSGLFTYEHRGSMATLKVSQTSRDGELVQRISHLDGRPREVLRRGDRPDCLRAGDLLLRGNVLASDGEELARLQNYYDFHVKGEGRVAGRPVVVLHVIPRDKYRYGYIFALERETGLMLQSMLVSETGKPLERFQFVEIEIGNNIDQGLVAPEGLTSQVVDVDDRACLVSDAGKTVEASDLGAAWVPPGFVLADKSTDAENAQETLVFTDGLAVFSVFIDALQGQMLPAVDAQLGATVAVLAKTKVADKEYAVSVVGEIPKLAAEKIAMAVSSSL